ncbi:MAG: GreA/GreB family elongation factor [Clostridium sp.]|nr:GreA/GreB family elongation factor [Clostridium sp.]
MRNNLLSREIYDYLSWHVGEIERKKEILFNEHYVEETQECINFKAFFKDYIDYINSYLDTVKVGKGGMTTCPFVIIDSVVDVFDTEEMENCQYHIVLPFVKGTDTAIDCASCLSPLGRALLLKAENDNVNVQIPTGVLNYTIKNITLPNTKEATDTKVPLHNGSTAVTAD